MERKHKWQSQGSLCYVLLSLGWRETSAGLIYFNLTKRSAKVPSSEHRRIAIACRNLYANIRQSTHSTWMNHFPFGIRFPPFYRNERINFWTICVDNRSARLPAKKKMENLVAFYGWYNSIPLLFLVPKKNYHLSLTENFHLDLRISVCILANRCFPFD